MTKDEKKLNFMDLQAYKISDSKLHSLVPGFQNTKHDLNGSPALKNLMNTAHPNSSKAFMSPNNLTGRKNLYIF